MCVIYHFCSSVLIAYATGERQKETSELRDRLEKETSSLKDALNDEIKARELDRDNFQSQLGKIEKEAQNERNELQRLLDKEREERINQANEMDTYFRCIISLDYFSFPMIFCQIT